MPADYSTQPIGMLSPAELGCIHRGSKWNTLNLAYYRDVLTQNDPTGGGSAYSAGDANILDQVKFTKDNYVYGKIELNIQGVDSTSGEKNPDNSTAKNSRVLQALFSNIIKLNKGNVIDISAGTSYYLNPKTARTGTGRGQYTSISDAKSIASKIIYYRNKNFGGAFKTRVEMLKDADIRNLLTQTLGGPKLVNEQFICDFINLCKATKTTQQMTIQAQAFKDIGTACSSNGYPVTGSLGMKIFNSDGSSLLCRKGVYDDGYDSITAERSYFVDFSIDAKTNKWRVKSLKSNDN